MALTQQTFLGASISSFNGSLGWSGQPSQLQVRLVEDPVNGDSFTQIGMGNPVLFNYSGWIFGGLVSDWVKERGSAGNPTYQVTLTDPTPVLDAVEVILDSYNGQIFNVPNIVNAFGYWENRDGFGGSRVNDTGMPWKKVKEAIESITTLSSTGAFGGPAQYRISSYQIDLSGLPTFLSDSYRVSGNNVTILDFIRDVCDAAGCDFFVTLQTVGLNFVIRVHTISRLRAPTLGAITNFIQTTDGAVSKNSGFELSTNPTSRFLVGGNKNDMFFQINDIIETNAQNALDRAFATTPSDIDEVRLAGTLDDATNNTIWPFWGFDANGEPILGKGFEKEHTFKLDARRVLVEELGAFYKTTVAELQAASESQSAWEFFLWLNNYTANLFDSSGNAITTSPNPHFQKAEKFGIVGPINKNVMQALDTKLKQSSNVEIGPLSKSQILLSSLTKGNSKEEEIKRLYDFVKFHADEYYGRQFMVRIPSTLVKVEDDTEKIVVSLEPTDSGFIDESNFNDALTLNLIPEDVDRITTNDGRLQAYVRFQDLTQLDGSDFDSDDLILSSKRIVNVPGEGKQVQFDVFVKCEVLPGVTFLDKETQFSPRVVIKLPGKMKRYTKDFGGQFYKLFDKITTGADLGNFIRLYHTNAFGADNFFFSEDGIAIVPRVAAIPLQSNIDTYGPWYATGVNGKTVFDVDETLVPWNYAGFNVMNTVAQASVNTSVSNNLEHETGNIEIPDVPTQTLGSALTAGGPYVTNVNVKVDEGGITSTYKLQTWVTNFGTLTKFNSDRLQTLVKAEQKNRRKFRQIFRPKRFKREKTLIGILTKDPSERVNSNSTHFMLTGETFSPEGLEPKVKHTAAIQPTYNMITQLNENYTNKAGMSLDGMFRPSSTKTNDTILPHFEVPTASSISEGGNGPTIDDLNPFQDGHDVAVMLRGDALPDNLAIEFDDYDDNNRFMALKGPVVVTGWGFDTEDNPTPSGEDGEFLADYLKRADKWKTGPVDLRWDKDRKVWAAGGTFEMKEGFLIDNIAAAGTPSGTIPSSGRLDVWEGTGTNWDTINENIYVTNRDFSAFYEDRLYMITFKAPNGEWRPLWASCSDDERFPND